MQPFPLSVALGPSLAPFVEPDGLDYLPLPEAMRTFIAPRLPEPEDARDLFEARRVLHLVLDAAQGWTPGQALAVIDLASLPQADLALIGQVLGEGEVSARVEYDGCALAIQESVLAGIWRVSETGGQGADRIEVGDIPVAIGAAIAQGLPRPRPQGQGPGLMNGPGILAEIAAALEVRGAAGEAASPHSINLSLLPMSPEDGAWLDASLGRGPVTLLSRGYGNCRIVATAVRDLWWVQYFNSQDTLILNSLELARVPEIARAATEDLADSAVRLADILDWLGDDAKTSSSSASSDGLPTAAA